MNATDRHEVGAAGDVAVPHDARGLSGSSVGEPSVDRRVDSHDLESDEEGLACGEGGPGAAHGRSAVAGEGHAAAVSRRGASRACQRAAKSRKRGAPGQGTTQGDAREVERNDGWHAVALTADRACAFNRQVLEGLKVEEGVVPGEIRHHSVTVGRYLGAPAEDCRYLLERLCTWLEGADFAPQPGLELVYAILKAIVAHVYLAWIHPFGDGNGRTARLMEFQILMVAGVPTPAAHLLSNHYNQTRGEYYRQLDAAGRSGGNLIPFIEYAVQGFVDALRLQIEVIREQQWEVAWRDFVYRSFGANPPAPRARQCQLVLALGGRGGFVPIDELPLLSAQLAAIYARRSSRILYRDLAELLRRGLVERTPAGVRARKELILAFLPWRQGA